MTYQHGHVWRKRLVWLLLSPFLVGIAATTLCAEGFVYVNDNVSGPNTVSAFSVAADGALTLTSGSPFPTGGNGSGSGTFAANRIAASRTRNLLFVANDGSDTISVFSVDPATGGLTPAPGSPFRAGGSGGSGTSLAETPDGLFLIASHNGSSDITVFSVGADGALAPVPGSPFPLNPGASPVGMKVSPDGRFLALALAGLDGAVGILSIASTGALTPVLGSPFPHGGAAGIRVATGVDINSRSDLLFVSEANGTTTIVDVFGIGEGGVLTPIPGPPFTPGGGVNSNVALLSPDNRLLFVSNQLSRTITVLRVALDSTLAVVDGSPFLTGSDRAPAGMATNMVGTLLFVANASNSISAFRVASDGVLTLVSDLPFPTGQQGFSQAITFFLPTVPPTVPADTTPPVTTATLSPGPAANGWNNADVTVTLNAADDSEGTGVRQIAFSLAGAQGGEGVVSGGIGSVGIKAEGMTTLEYSATDNAGNREPPKTITVRIDKTGPTVACSASPTLLWPPDHRMAPVTATVTVTDVLSGQSGFALTSVTPGEDGGADDVEGFVVGTESTSGLLRAERSGQGDGRVYTLTYTGVDAARNPATCSVTITVPHDQGQ